MNPYLEPNDAPPEDVEHEPYDDRDYEPDYYDDPSESDYAADRYERQYDY